MNTETLPLADFIKDVLPFELLSRAKGRPIQIVSDFDETQSSAYVFSNKWDTHVPKIRADLSREAQRLTRPMCLATARTSDEPVSWIMWQRLSRLPMPLVAENGAVLVWPSEKITQPAKIEVLASPEQSEALRQIQKELKNGLINRLKVPIGHEIVLGPGSVVTVEIRAQEIISKRGTPDDYIALNEQLVSLFPDTMSQIDIVSSGSSLSMQPKGVDKGAGIMVALSRIGVNMHDVFLIGLGDNRNDEPLFSFVKKNQGLTIGVRPSVGNMCDFIFDGGDEVSTQVLKIVNSL